MSSGSYFPPPVRAVEIPKSHGGGTEFWVCLLCADRIAQTVVARRLEARGRTDLPPGLLRLPAAGGRRWTRSGHAGSGAGRYDWVIDLDIQKFFDSVPWDLVVKAVEANTDLPWVVLYVKRWLQAPLQLPDGTLTARDRGTPQGSAVSPVLANLFLHYAFDAWMARTVSGCVFERYVDDAVVHCVSEAQARQVLAAIAERMEQVGLATAPR